MLPLRSTCMLPGLEVETRCGATMTVRVSLEFASLVAMAIASASCAGVLGLDRGLPDDDAGLEAGLSPAQNDGAASDDRASGPVESGGPVLLDGSPDDGASLLDRGVSPTDAAAASDGPADLDAPTIEEATTADATSVDASGDATTAEDSTAATDAKDDATDAEAPDDSGVADNRASGDLDADDGAPAHDAAADRSPPADAGCATLACTVGGCCDPVPNGELVCNANGSCGHLCSSGYIDCGGNPCSCAGGNVCLADGSTGTCGACRKTLGACQKGSDCCSGMCTLSLTCL